MTYRPFEQTTNAQSVLYTLGGESVTLVQTLVRCMKYENLIS